MAGWRARLTFLLGVLCAVLLLFGAPEMGTSRFVPALWDLGHVFAFFLWFRLLDHRSPRFRGASDATRLLLVAAAALGGGALAELFQAQTGRSADPLDLLRNLLGGMAALAYFEPVKPLRPPLRPFLRRVAGAGAVLALLPLATVAFDRYRMWRDFPSLGDFEEPLEVRRWSGDAAVSRAVGVCSRGKHSLRIELNTRGYSGIFLDDLQGDWRGWRTLRFEVFLPSPGPLSLNIRIFDRRHPANGMAYADRFNASRPLLPGWNSIAVDLAEVAAAPQRRRMDLGEIVSFGVFAAGLPAPVVIYLDDLRLEK